MISRSGGKKPTGSEVDPRDREFGQRVKRLREEREFTQRQLAAELDKTSSWLSQVERGIQPVTRIDVMQAIADALRVPVQRLNPSAGPHLEQPAPVPDSPSNDLDRARQLITGHPTIDTLLGVGPARDVASLEDLGADVDELWSLTHADKFAEISQLCGELLPALEHAVRVVDASEKAEGYRLLARMYQALAAAFVRQQVTDAAWIAADRAISAAERSGDPLLVCAGIFRMVHAFVRLRDLGQAEHAARSAVTALSQRSELGPEGLSVLGALRLSLALINARNGSRSGAREEIDAARRIAAQIGEDRNDYNLEFGPTNVEINAVSTAIDLGDAGEAIDIGLAIDASDLSLERQGRLLMDMGRAYAQRRKIPEATDSLLRAEGVTAQLVRGHDLARSTIKELVLISGDNVTSELIDLAERADAMP